MLWEWMPWRGWRFIRELWRLEAASQLVSRSASQQKCRLADWLTGFLLVVAGVVGYGVVAFAGLDLLALLAGDV
jgi:hypothetical protein